jgi:hypothetical protein
MMLPVIEPPSAGGMSITMGPVCAVLKNGIR